MEKAKRPSSVAGGERLARRAKIVKEGNRERLMAAAAESFVQRGYGATIVDDIVKAAGVSRITFYRHFHDKAAIAIAIYDSDIEQSMALFLRIRDEDFRSRAIVRRWIGDLFDKERPRAQLLHAYSSAAVEAPEFLVNARALVGRLIREMGERIPAFAEAERTAAEGLRPAVEASLILYEILRQSDQAAKERGRQVNPVLLEVLTDRFLNFVTSNSPALSLNQ